jgi:hypothetical protein
MDVEHRPQRMAIPASFGILVEVAYMAPSIVEAGQRRREPDV